VWTNIGGGQSLLFVYASSPLLEGTGDILLGQHALSNHTAEHQARIIGQILKLYCISMDNVKWFCGDNVAANWMIARILKVPFANCIPHSLNLVIQQFMQPFKVTSKMPLLSSFVTLGVSSPRRQLLTSFGLQLTKIDYSSTRWQGLLEAMMYLVGDVDEKRDSIRRSSVDNNKDAFSKLKKKVRESAAKFAEEEQKKAAETLRQRESLSNNNEQLEVSSKRHERMSTRQIRQSSSQGLMNLEDDEDLILHASGHDLLDAAEEIMPLQGSTTERPTVWRQFFHYVLAADTFTITAQKTIAFLSDWTAYAEALLLTQCLQKMPAIISMAEGGHSYTGNAKEGTEVAANTMGSSQHDNAIIKVESEITMFMDNIQKLSTDEHERNNKVDSALKAAKEGAYRYFYTEMSTDVTDPFLNDTVRDSAFKEATKVIDGCKGYLLTLLENACSDIFTTPSPTGELVHKWVDKGLRRLKLRRIFLLRHELPPIPKSTLHTTNDDAIWQFLKPLLPMEKRGESIVYPTTYAGCTPASFFEAYINLQNYVNGNGVYQPLVGKVNDPIKFFKERSADMSLTPADRVLAKLAIRALVTPLSSVAAERAGSYLRKLGAGKDRNRMGEEALEDNMFMWANQHYGDKLMILASNRASLVAKTLAVQPKTADDADDLAEQARELVRHPPAKRTKEQEGRAAICAARPTGIGLQQSSASLKPTQPPLTQHILTTFFTPATKKVKDVIQEEDVEDLLLDKEEEMKNKDEVLSFNDIIPIDDDDDNIGGSSRAQEMTSNRSTKTIRAKSSSHIRSKRAASPQQREELDEYNDDDDNDDDDDDDDIDVGFQKGSKRHKR
jgi:hypothetical protein